MENFEELQKRIHDLECKLDLYKQIIEQLPLGIQIFDCNGTSYYLNEKQKQLLGLPDTTTGIGDFNVLSDPYAKASGAAEIYKKVYSGKIHSHIYKYNLGIEENEWETRNDTRIFKEKIIPIPCNDNPSEFVFAILDDITEKIKAEEKLKDSEKKYRDFVNHSPDIIYKFSNKKGATFWSARVKDILGYDPDELKSNPFLWTNSIHPEDKPKVIDAIDDYNKGRDYSIEYRIKTKSGQWLWLHDYFMHKTTINDEIIIEGHAADITERKKLEIELEGTKQRFELAMQATKDGLWDWNLKTNEVYFSPNWKKMLGFDEHEIKNTIEEWDKRVHPEDKEKTYEDVNKHLNGETESYRNEHRVLCKDGTYKWILDRGIVVKWDKKGTPLRMIGTHTDITDRKNHEKHLAEINHFKDKIFSIITHDLRSPFNAILGLNEIVLNRIETGDYDTAKEITEAVYKTSQQTLGLLDNLLYWSRMQTGKFYFKPGLINLKKTINTAIEYLKLNLTDKHLKVIHDIPENFNVIADRTMLETILRNLISNAIKFSYDNNSIEITASRKENMVKISVTDHGVGISKAKLNKIFDVCEKFTTPGTNQEKGTGLGLIVCKEFVENHNGTICVESEVQKGTTFTFSIVE